MLPLIALQRKFPVKLMTDCGKNLLIVGSFKINKG